MTWRAFLNAISTVHRDLRGCLEAQRSIAVQQIEQLAGAIRRTPMAKATCTPIAFRGSFTPRFR